MRLPTVLLARPHPFIEKAMSDLLIKHGFAPAVVPSLEKLRAADTSLYYGAVISTAILSREGKSHQETLEILHRLDPTLPIIFATLAPLDPMAQKLAKDVETINPEASLATLADPGLLKKIRHQPRPYLVLQKADLEDSPFEDLLVSSVSQLFRPRATTLRPLG